MSIDRSISKKRYIIAGVITLLLFFLGILFGMVIDGQRINLVEEKYDFYDLSYRSLQLQYSLLESTPTENVCAVFDVAINNAVEELLSSLEQVENYKEVSGTQQDNFDVIKRRYILDNVKYWLLVKKAEDVCGADRLSVLYFFSEKKCPHCSDQGVILTYYKKIYGEQLLVFPIDVDFMDSEPVIDVLINAYNITTYPSLVIEDTLYSGMVSKGDLSEIICDKLDSASEDCG